ncbi:response regulator transcription factor [Mucilaginibacter auburnensis]|uniref:DNA-binding response OmpR family regulator n=1 Tax=Mucilaginibacter auburnensis TaxID=1457233 RepID=A0A2H9VNV5_9SPHI|nr:response regulator transcription factor [Mucilaginibacter auburnensis]PJJ79993.1 DNA-binding response OmpR family regulator [Mucilaginibacter auburnensis]
MNILVVEDEVKVAAFIAKGLEEQLHHVTVAYDGNMGCKLGLENDHDLIILDIALPYVNGVDVCKTIRQVKKDVPILMLSALDSLRNKVDGLEAGADDYLTKPFHFEELLARIKAITRRREMILPGTIYKVDDLEMDCFRKTVSRNGKIILLSAKEFTLLEVLMANKERVLSRVHIAEKVWGISFNRGTNLIDVYINYLRAKIDKGQPKQLIHTVIGMGYIIKD